MLFSILAIGTTWNNYKKSKKLKKESYLSDDNTSNDALTSAYILVISIIIFCIEFILLGFAIYIAVTCTNPGAERLVHVVLAITVTIPYILLKVVCDNSGCTKTKLQEIKF